MLLLDYEPYLRISVNLAKTVIKSCATCVYHTFSHETTSARWFYWSALEASPNRFPSWTRRKRRTSWLWEGTLSARMSCNVYRWILGCVALCDHVCEMHDAPHLLILSSPKSEQTVSFMVWWPFAKLVASSGIGAQLHHPGDLKQNFEVLTLRVRCIA